MIALATGKTDGQTRRIAQIEHWGIELTQRGVDRQTAQGDASFGIEQRCGIGGQEQCPAVVRVRARGELEIDQLRTADGRRDRVVIARQMRVHRCGSQPGQSGIAGQQSHGRTRLT